ncbi:IS3 family transposase [Puniceicoccus vermicola]|uniref:IS3 family transposase n=1 Tax=Puniceicoccus vermicola TaxID=388746 RepID=UPI0033966BE9
MIEAMRKDYSVCELCGALGLSRSGFYAWDTRKVAPGPRAVENQRIVAEIKTIHADRHMRCYGSPRITPELAERGLPCGENRVARLMRKEGLRGKLRRPWRPKTTKTDSKASPSPNLLKKEPAPTKPGEQLVADITYIPTEEGWMYLSVVMDLFSRLILGWNLSCSLSAEQTVRAIDQARLRLPIHPTAIFHSDRGCQYASGPLRTALGKWKQSMSAKGYCYDNAFAESCFASFKTEMLPDSGCFHNKKQAHCAIFDYIECFYNRRRRHSSLGMISPQRYLEQYYNLQPQLN